LPTGTLAVAVGLIVSGVAAYAFLVVADHALRVEGPDNVAPLTAIWAMVFFLGPGFFLPLEQEVSRATAGRRVRGEGIGPLVQRAAIFGGGLGVAVALACVVARPFLVESVFHGQGLLWVALLVSVISFPAAHLLRGVVSGRGRFAAYSLFIGADGVIRLALCVVLAVVGVRTAGPYGLAIALAPLVAVLLVIPRSGGLTEAGPPSPMGELSSNLGALLVGSVFAQGLANAAMLAPNLLADASEKGDVKRLFNGVIVARVPLFLFQAVQAALLPRLAALASGHSWHEFRLQLSRLLAAVAAIGALGTVGGFVAGPMVVGLLFDAELGHRDVGLLAAGTAFFIIAMSLAQALIAVERPARMAAGWVAGVAAFVVVAALGDDLMLRVQLAAVSGSLTAAVAMAVSLLARLRQIDPALLVRGTVPAPVPEFGVTAPLDQDRSATQRTDWPKGGRRRRSLQRTKGTASRS
jgi:O-antigen/teichoic acid export membrane protein